MVPTPCCRLIAAIMAAFVFSSTGSVWAQGFPRGHRDALGPRYQATPHHRESAFHRQRPAIDFVRHWNQIAIDASGLDHTPVAVGETRVFGEQFGPTRSIRAIAIVHIAIFDAVVAINGGYRSYTGIAPAPKDTSMDAAVAQAAHDTLSALFPSQAPNFDMALDDDLKLIANGLAKNRGIDLGRRAAAAILELRANDGSEHAEPRVGVDYITGDEPGEWRQDPISLLPLALGARWAEVKPFTMESATQFRFPLRRLWRARNMRRLLRKLSNWGAMVWLHRRCALLSRRGSASIGPTMARLVFALHHASITKSQPRSPIKWR